MFTNTMNARRTTATSPHLPSLVFTLFHPFHDCLVKSLLLFVKCSQDPQKNGHVPVLTEEYFWVTKLVSKLLSQFLFREQRYELTIFDARVGARASTIRAANDLVTDHTSTFAVLRARA